MSIEDIKTVVIDSGSSSTKVGFGGDTEPSVIFPTAVTHTGREWHIGEDLSGMPEYPIADGIVQNWGDMEHVWDHAFCNALHSEPKDHAVLLVENVNSPKSARAKSAEIMFEKFGVPALGIEASPVLSLYIAGLTDGVVLECGDGRFTATPVFNGNVIRHAITRSGLTGHLLTERMNELMPDVQPQVAKAIKEKYCYVSANMEEDMLVSAYGGDKETYTLPGGRVITLGSERFKCPEVLFRTELLKTVATRPPESVQAIVYSAISKCIPDIQTDLFTSIMPIGGTSLIQGFDERLKKELLAFVPNSEVKIIAGGADRSFAAWAGGSFITLNPAARSSWITAADYAEYGYEQWSRRMVRPGEVEPIVTRMREANSTSEEGDKAVIAEQNFGIEALGYTALFTPRFVMSIIAQGGIETILATMKKNAEDVILQESCCLALSFILAQDSKKERFCSQLVMDYVSACAERFPESEYIKQSLMALRREDDPCAADAVKKGVCTAGVAPRRCPLEESGCPFAAGHYYCPGCCVPQKMFFCATCAKEGGRSQLFCETCWKHHTKNHEGVKMFVSSRCHCEEMECKAEKQVDDNAAAKCEGKVEEKREEKKEENSAMSVEKLKTFSEEQVIEWLESVGIKSEKTNKAIVSEEISGEALVLMTKEDLVGSGIPAGSAVRIIAQLQKLK